MLAICLLSSPRRFFFDSNSLNFVANDVDWAAADYPSPAEIVSIIKSAGGHPILAHPGSTLLSNGFSEKDMEDLIDMGVEGLECFTTYHDKEMTQKYIEFCRKRDLLITAGSDCHGSTILKSRKLGQPEPPFKDLNLKGIWPDQASIV